MNRLQESARFIRMKVHIQEGQEDRDGGGPAPSQPGPERGLLKSGRDGLP